MRFIPFLLWLCLIAPPGFVYAQQSDNSEYDIYSDEAAFADDDLADPDLESIPAANDPFEGFNRAMFWFNDKLYFYALKPVAKAYRVIPEPARTSVSNFYSNITTPVRLGNALLQGKFHDAAGELTRFIFNTTIGVGGLFDPADKLGGVRKKDEDFGQTLGHYGIGQGFYLVLPFFGPSSARDGIGLMVDTIADPVDHVWENGDYWTAKGVDYLNTISLDKDTYEAIKRDAFDPYLFIRDAYLNNRQRKVEQ